MKAREAGNWSPFSSVEEVVRRAEPTWEGAETLAAAKAFGGLGVDRRSAIWAARRVEKDIPPLLLLAARSAAAGEPPLLPEPDPTLPSEQPGQKVVTDDPAHGYVTRAPPS